MVHDIALNSDGIAFKNNNLDKLQVDVEVKQVRSKQSLNATKVLDYSLPAKM